MKRPNVIWLCADMIGAANFGCYGDPAGLTPAVDRLAAQGVRFDRFYCACTPCIPARVSMFTGQYAHTHGKIAHIQTELAPRPTLVTEVLAGAGYRTGFVGKTHWWPSSSDLGCHDAYPTIDTHLMPELGEHDAYLRYLKSLGLFDYRGETWQEDRRKLMSPDGIPFEHLRANWTGDQTIRLLEEYAAGEAPFFLFCSFVEPHGGTPLPAEYLRRLESAAIPAPIGSEDEHAGKPATQRKAVQAWRKSQGEIHAARRNVYNALNLVDTNIARILEALEKLGLSDDTLVLFTTDHGDLMYDHGCIEKTFLYDSAVRIPLIIRGPDTPKGQARNHLANQVDLMPTVLDACGVGTEGLRIQGRSLLPVVRRPQEPWRNAVFCEADQTVHLGTLVRSSSAKMVRTEGWKYIYTLVDGNIVEEELYDMERDPQELRNLAADPGHGDRLRGLRDELLRWLVASEPDRLVPAPENHYKVPAVPRELL